MIQTYKRRSVGTVRCSDVYAYEIVLNDEEPCDSSSGACAWKGFFSVSMYNGDPSLCTYEWSVSNGTFPNGYVDQNTELWVSASANTLITVTCIVTCGAKQSTISKDFMTKNIL